MKENAKLTQAFEELKSVPDRDPAAVQQNRAAFLREAAQLSQQPVSNSVFARLIGNYRLTHTRMQFSTLTIGILLAVLMLTFSSGVYAARKSAPSQLLYPVKLWLEDSRLAFTRNPHEQLDLRLAFAEERLNEIEGYSGQNTDPDLAAALKNFDDHYLVLSGENDLDNVQEQRWEKIQEQYQLIHSDDEGESDNHSDETENPEGQSSQDTITGENDELNAPANTPDPGEGQSETNAEDTPTETENGTSSGESESHNSENSTENSPEETQTPNDGSNDSEENPTEEPDPTPNEPNN